MKYFLWRSDRGDDYCVIEEPEIEDSWDITDGVPRIENQSEPIVCNMSSSFPKNIRLSDNLYGATVPIISSKLKAQLERLTQSPIEYLPVSVVNHKRRTESAEYFVLHPIGLVDCIDVEASGVQWNRIAPDQISRCEALILKGDAAPDAPCLFRPKSWGDNIVVSQDLKELLEGAGLTGLSFRPTEEYKGIG